MLNTKHIFLFGHRKQHGKDVSATLLEKILKEKEISCHRTFFAKYLKKVVAEKYGLDYEKMVDDDNTYKSSIPEHLKGLSVRDVLIKEGVFSRGIWDDTWASIAYNEILNSNKTVGIISDFRFPNERDNFIKIFNQSNKRSLNDIPKVHKVLVYRPNGIFSNDGADDQVPDDESYWDFVIRNDDNTDKWKDNITRQLYDIITKVL